MPLPLLFRSTFSDISALKPFFMDRFSQPRAPTRSTHSTFSHSPTRQSRRIQKVQLANLHALFSEDVIRRDEMEEESRQAILLQVLQSSHFHFFRAQFDIALLILHGKKKNQGQLAVARFV